MATLQEATRKTEQLAKVIRDRSPEAEKSLDYYAGQQSLRFASPEYREYFAGRYDEFADNWTGIVADSPGERLNPIGIRLDNGDGKQVDDQELWRAWRAEDADTEVGLAMLDAIVARRSFGMVWGNDDDESRPRITFESATECAVAYEPGSRVRRVAGLKMWREDNTEYARLFLRDEVWKFERAAAMAVKSPLIVIGNIGAGGWKPVEDPDEPNPKPNPMGEVPIVEFPNRPLLSRDPLSDVSGVMAMQDAVNLLWSQLFVAADFASFPQRVVLGAEKPTLPILGEDGQEVGRQAVDLKKFAVNRVVWLEDPEAKIGEWQAADLSVYTSVIEVAVGHIAAQTRTPQHYLVGKMANLAEGALKAAETGLVMRCKEKQVSFGQALRELFRLIALAQGNKAKAKAVGTGEIRWKDAESRSESQLVDSLLKLQTLGMPFEYLVERYGLTPPEIVRVMQLRQNALERVIGGDPEDTVGPKPGADAEEIKKKSDAMGVLIRSGVERDEAARIVGLGDIQFSDLYPVSLGRPEE